MSRRCPRCHAENLLEAKYCEHCGLDLDAPSVPGDPATSLSPRPGSLREAIPFLTGGVEQAKARFDGWKQQKTRDDTEKARERHFQEQRNQGESSSNETKREGFGATVTRVMVGILALAILIYILVRNPKFPPWMAQQLVGQLLEEWTT